MRIYNKARLSRFQLSKKMRKLNDINESERDLILLDIRENDRTQTEVVERHNVFPQTAMALMRMAHELPPATIARLPHFKQKVFLTANGLNELVDVVNALVERIQVLSSQLEALKEREPAPPPKKRSIEFNPTTIHYDDGYSAIEVPYRVTEGSKDVTKNYTVNSSDAKILIVSGPCLRISGVGEVKVTLESKLPSTYGEIEKTIRVVNLPDTIDYVPVYASSGQLTSQYPSGTRIREYKVADSRATIKGEAGNYVAKIAQELNLNHILKCEGGPKSNIILLVRRQQTAEAHYSLQGGVSSSHSGMISRGPVHEVQRVLVVLKEKCDKIVFHGPQIVGIGVLDAN